MLMGQLDQHRRIDFSVPQEAADPRCSTTGLFGEAGGKMFGILSCRDAHGRQVVLRAFSGQYNGLWQVDGWVGPIFDVAAFNELVAAPEQEIKRVGKEMAALPKDSHQRRGLVAFRRTLSRTLMQDIHHLYQLVNFRGEKVPLLAAFNGKTAPPAGTGDCCGPKLLHHAVTHGLQPEGMIEFYWGRSNASCTKMHSRLYSACAAKCQPILGFMLCGLGEQS